MYFFKADKHYTWLYHMFSHLAKAYVSETSRSDVACCQMRLWLEKLFMSETQENMVRSNFVFNIYSTLRK